MCFVFSLPPQSIDSSLYRLPSSSTFLGGHRFSPPTTKNGGSEVQVKVDKGCDMFGCATNEIGKTIAFGGPIRSFVTMPATVVFVKRQTDQESPTPSTTRIIEIQLTIDVLGAAFD
ncbi:hypothetical protein ACFE04_021059 [Oxalis oulophora]